MSEYIVGLTGGIGSGKTTIANNFAELGIQIIDADTIARDVVMPKTLALEKIKTYFGDDIIMASGELDRAKLRTKVFNNIEDKHWLNNLLHPLIRQEMMARVKAATSLYCILVVPLLIENKLTPLVDHILVIDVDAKTQLSRASVRDNNDEALIQKIIDSQISRDERLSYADDIIDNQYQSFSEIKENIKELHTKYLSYV